MVRLVISEKVIFVYIVVIQVVLSLCKLTPITQEHFETKITPFLKLAEDAGRQFMETQFSSMHPACFWDISPAAGVFVNRRLKNYIRKKSHKATPERVAGKLVSPHVDTEDIEDASGEISNLEETHSDSRSHLLNTFNENASVQFHITHATIDILNPSRLIFHRKRFRWTNWKSIDISLICPAHANSILVLKSILPKAEWSKWVFAFDNSEKTFYIVTPKKKTYEIINIPFIFDNLIKSNHQFRSGSSWSVIPQRVTKNGEPRKNILVFFDPAKHATKLPSYLLMQCSECSDSEYIFNTVSSARNLGAGSVINLQHTPISSVNFKFSPTVLKSDSSYRSNVQLKFMQWLKTGGSVSLTSALNHIKFKSGIFFKKYSKIIYIQTFTVCKGVFFIYDAKKKIHEISFESKTAFPMWLMDQVSIPVSLSFQPIKGDLSRAMIEDIETTEYVQPSTLASISNHVGNGNESLQNVKLLVAKFSNND